MIKRIIRRAITKRPYYAYGIVKDAGMEVLIEERYSSMLKNYNTKPQNLEDYKKQLRWRARNLGMKEMDLLVSAWADENLENCSMEETVRFEREILNMETPDLFKLVFMPLEQLDEFQLSDEHYLFKIRKFALTGWNKA